MFAQLPVPIYILFLLAPTPALAALVADDNASQDAYNTGSPLWDNGDNGGSGFQPWKDLGNASTNGAGGVFIGGGTSIDVGGEAFGVFGHNGGNTNHVGVGQAVRPFTGTLAINQTFSLSMDNGFIHNNAENGNTGNPGTVGFGLQNASGDNLFEFFFVGGTNFYQTNSDGGASDTNVGFTSEGLNLTFTLTDSDSFTFTIDRIDTVTSVDQTVMGDLINAADQGVAQIRIFNANSGPDSENNVFFNSFSIAAIPEPTAFLFGSLIASAVGLRVCRRQRSRG